MDSKPHSSLLSEVLDPNKIVMYCGRHFYSAQPGSQPVGDCVDCWKVFYISEAASMNPSERRERLEHLQQLVHHMAESAERGELDFEFFEHPVIEAN